jgi:hypothetical protein
MAIRRMRNRPKSQCTSQMHIVGRARQYADSLMQGLAFRPLTSLIILDMRSSLRIFWIRKIMTTCVKLLSKKDRTTSKIPATTMKKSNLFHMLRI